MSELQFSKQFLTSLDSKTTKYQPDHVFDPKTFTVRVPYTLPRLPHPPHPLPPKSGPGAPKAPGAEPAEGSEITVVLKSPRNPKMELRLSELNGATTIQSLKESVQSHLGGASVVTAEKVKILLNKKPIPPSKKTIAEAFEGSDVEGKDEVELAVMVMGGAPDPAVSPGEVPKPMTPVPGSRGTETPVPAGDAMEGVEKTADATDGASWGPSSPEFWTDLESFLSTKMSSQGEAHSLRRWFENAWGSSNSVS